MSENRTYALLYHTLELAGYDFLRVNKKVVVVEVPGSNNEQEEYGQRMEATRLLLDYAQRRGINVGIIPTDAQRKDFANPLPIEITDIINKNYIEIDLF